MRCTVKKTLAQLVALDSHYVVTVKGNQGNLKKQCERLPTTQTPQSEYRELNCSHGRQVERYTRVYEASAVVREAWPQAQSMIVIERCGIREGKAFNTRSYHLSNLVLKAQTAGAMVRRHRDIENGLHWVRDVVLSEDDSLITQRTPAVNWSVLRSIVLNLFRAAGYHSLTRAIRLIGNNLDELLFLLTMN